MSLYSNIEMTASRLLESRSDSKSRLLIVQSIKENLEICSTSDYEFWLRQMFPALTRSLGETKCGVIADDVDHKVRQTIIEIFTRLPQNEILKPYVGSVFSVFSSLKAARNPLIISP